MPTAILPMYDWPEARAATDRFWGSIRAALARSGLDAPGELSRPDDLLSAWTNPGLLLAQTCGYPFATRLCERVVLVGTPAYAIDCAPGRYCSVIVARRSDAETPLDRLASGRFAYNERGSQSGFRAPLRHLVERDLPIPAMIETGAHRASIRAVADGSADFAGIDAVTWELALRHEPSAERLSVVGRTPETWGLPYITAAVPDTFKRAATLFRAIKRAIADLDPATRQTLLIKGLVRTAPAEYASLANPIAGLEAAR